MSLYEPAQRRALISNRTRQLTAATHFSRSQCGGLAWPLGRKAQRAENRRFMVSIVLVVASLLVAVVFNLVTPGV
jgi:hypothetical protein